MKKIEMVDLKGQYENIKEQVNQSVLETIESTMFINGPLCLLCSSRANNLYLLNIVKIFGNLLNQKTLL